MPDRCSECQRPLKPVVALDIDGTLGDYHAHFIQFAEGYTGDKLPGPSGYDGSMRFWEYLGMELPLYRDIKLAYRQGGLKRTMPPYLGASELSRRVKEAGAEIWICTTRPWLRLDNIDPDTREWLRRNNVSYDHMIYGDDKYEQLSTLVKADRVVGVLEDLPEQVEIAAHLGFDPIMIAQPHNYLARTPSGAMVASGLGLAARALESRVLTWHAQQQ